jgi:pyruvate/2-oxoglutarate dehydrogenase complex dihydrolipoamide dehydrogenase (E3) component
VSAILAREPDAVIVATGATPRAPALDGDGSVPIHAFDSEVPENLPDGHWVVMDEDGYYWAAALTEYLARQGKKVTYVTRFMQPLREVPEVSRMSTLRALDRHGVTLLDNVSIARADRGALVGHRYFNETREIRLEGVRGLVWAGMQQVNDDIVRQLQDAGVSDVHVVGDAKSPRRLSHALAEGHRAARAV